jgi:hypothetical protein
MGRCHGRIEPRRIGQEVRGALATRDGNMTEVLLLSGHAGAGSETVGDGSMIAPTAVACLHGAR